MIKQPQLAFVGRTPQLAVLDSALADARAGGVRSVVVAGDAGAGKTRLVAEFLQRQPQARAIVTHCLQLGPDGLPLAPFAGMLRPLTAELGRDGVAALVGDGIVELARLSSELGSAGPESPWGRGRLFEAFARLLEALPGPQPTILVIEDLHWSDAATRDLLRFLTANVTRPLLIVATYRSDELPRHDPLRGWFAEYGRNPRVTRLDLPPLTAAEVAALLSGRDLPARAVSEIVALSQGIPFFAEELGAAFAAGRGFLPGGLRNALTARAYQLSGPARQLVIIAAAALSPIPHQVLSEVAQGQVEDLEAAVAEAVENGILTVDSRGRYAFRHELTRTALGGDLLPGRRVSVHTAYAVALQRSGAGRAAEIARHWTAAHNDEQAARWTLCAAAEAAAVYAREDELRHLERLLELPRSVWPVEAGLHCDVLARAAVAAADSGFYERARDLLGEALREVGTQDPERLVWLSIARARLPLVAVPLAELRELIPLTAPGERARAMLLAVIASGLMVADEMDEGLRTAQEALAVATVADDPAIRSHVHNTLGCLLLAMGDDTAYPHFQRAHDLAVAAGSDSDLVRYYINYSALLLEAGRYPEALEVARRGRQYSAARGMTTGRVAFLAWQEAETLLLLGQWDEALGICEAGLQERPAEGTIAHLLRVRALIAARRGDAATARELNFELQRRMELVADRPTLMLPRACLSAEILAAEGRPADAVRLLRQAAAHGTDTTADHGPLLAILWASLLAAAGHAPQHDPDLVDFVASLPVRHPMWVPLGEALGAGRAQAWADLLSLTDSPNGPQYQAATLRLLHADALLRGGDRDAARREVRRATAILAPFGTLTIDGWRRRLAAATDRDAPGRETLTPRELEVLRLIAQGHSNRSISESLCISVKTTSVHVSSILAKLEVSSRTQAAALWHTWQG